MTGLTLVPNRHYTKVYGGKRFYWPLNAYTKRQAELESSCLAAEWVQFQALGHKTWPEAEGKMARLRIQQKLGIGVFKGMVQNLQANAGQPQVAVAPVVAVPTEASPIGPHMTFADIVGLFLTESISLTDKKKKDLRNRLNSAKSEFNGTPIGQYNRTKFIEVAGKINAKPLSDVYKRDIFQAIYRLFSWASERENLGFVAPGNLKQLLTPTKTTKTAAAVWDNEEEKYWTKKQVKLALSKATGVVRAFILLGLNCGYGTSEIGALQKSHLKNNGTMIQTIRGKTARNTRPAKMQHKLWAETTQAIQETMTKEGELVWSTSKGGDVATNDYVGKLFREFCQTNKLKLPQFKMLRKTSANDVKNNSNSDIASLHLGHSTKTVTEGFYVESNWKALAEATDKVREHYSDCF